MPCTGRSCRLGDTCCTRKSRHGVILPIVTAAVASKAYRKDCVETRTFCRSNRLLVVSYAKLFLKRNRELQSIACKIRVIVLIARNTPRNYGRVLFLEMNPLQIFDPHLSCSFLTSPQATFVYNTPAYERFSDPKGYSGILHRYLPQSCILCLAFSASYYQDRIIQSRSKPIRLVAR